jgi:hypothetical protein
MRLDQQLLLAATGQMTGAGHGDNRDRFVKALNLGRSQERFAAGVTDDIELVQAQQSLSSANDHYISGTHSHNLAKRDREYRRVMPLKNMLIPMSVPNTCLIGISRWAPHK